MQSLKFFIIACLIAPFGLLPLRWSQAIGSQLGLLLIKCNRKRAHISHCNLKVCFPEKSAAEREKLLLQNAMETGKWFLESAYVWFGNPDYLSKRVTVKNPQLLEIAHRQNRGVVIVLPHLGNWELLNFYIPKYYPFAAMYKPVKAAWFEKVIFKSRSRLGSKMFATNSSGVRQALKGMRNNLVLAILPDHLPTKEAGVYAPFFGQPALTGKLTQSLINSNQSEVLIASVVRKPKGQGFEIVFHRVEGMHTEDKVAAATALNSAIEKSILLAPEQYQWVYRRFANPPSGTACIYH
jgi:Kdo2-lipid IVA lauroyltransferase/acyltransferase